MLLGVQDGTTRAVDAVTGLEKWQHVLAPMVQATAAGMFKDFAVTERWRVRLQSQVRNLPNHPNFANPDLNITSGNYNRIRSLNTNSSARVVVVGARIIF